MARERIFRPVPWTLDNAEERAAEAPRSFFIPPPEVRRNLAVGDLVKLIFCLEREDGEYEVERMWVEVVQTEPLAGTLANEPYFEGVIAHGDRVEFGPEHVCAFYYDNADVGYPTGEPVTITHSILTHDTPPDRIHVDREGHWHAQVGDEPAVHEWELGYLTDKFPEAAEALREGFTPRGLRKRFARDVTWVRRGDGYERA
jgi:hypothetical protein